MILACTGCGATKPRPDGAPDDRFPSSRCGQCPPWQCETCGQTCQAGALCPCWTPVDGLALADLQGLLAAGGDGLTLTPGPPRHTEE